MATNSYEDFNKFQTAFYTSIKGFDEFTRFDVKRHGYTLLFNLAKGFPHLSNIILNLRGIGWSSAESPAILKALQRNFVNNFNVARVPQFIYFPSEKVEKSKEKVKSTFKGLVFDVEIQNQIKSILFIDSKTYEYLKFGKQIQLLGKQIAGEFMVKEKVKALKKK